MNLTLLDREQLEDILLDPPRVEVQPLQCSDCITLDCLPSGPAERTTRIRHVLAAAHELLVRSANTALIGRKVLDSPTLVKDYFKVHFAGAERETFVVIFLDSQMRVIASEELFSGTLTQTSVYPREVVKRALHHNAGAGALRTSASERTARALARGRVPHADAEVGAESRRRSRPRSHGRRRR